MYSTHKINLFFAINFCPTTILRLILCPQCCCLLYLGIRSGGGVFQGIGTRPAYAGFHPRQLKNQRFRNLFFDIVTTQYDHPRYVKHVLGRVYMIFTQIRFGRTEATGNAACHAKERTPATHPPPTPPTHPPRSSHPLKSSRYRSPGDPSCHLHSTHALCMCHRMSASTIWRPPLIPSGDQRPLHRQTSCMRPPLPTRPRWPLETAPSSLPVSRTRRGLQEVR